MKKPIPVSVLVGFLGSGKTTLLNHLLASNHGRKIAVIVNEFGAVNVDAALVRHATERTVEFSNGCICCTLREDLLHELRALSEVEGLEYILVESTGIGEPLPIAQTFYMADLPERVRLDSIITVVDAQNFWDTWNRVGLAEDAEGQVVEEPLAPLLADQLEFTNVVVLNKADTVSPEELGRLEAFIRSLNPQARIYPSVYGQLDPALLMDTGLYDYAEGWEEEPSEPSSEAEEYGFESFVFRCAQPLSWPRFEAEVLRAWPTQALRSKGFVAFADHPPILIQHAGMGLVYEVLEESAGEELETEVVFIGQHLLQHRSSIEARLLACRA
jgi:G3E family GTPase